jgi:Ni/Co efflux regulator RcnB
MKRLILTIAAVASVAAPMAAIATDASAQGRNERRDDRRDNRQDYRNDRRDDRRDYRDDRRDDRRDYRNDRRDYRPQPQARWDNNRYNGYYYNNRWNYGAPPSSYYGRPGYQPGYQAWRRGGYLPPSYRGYVVRDYGRYGLRAPPRGYYWYQSGNDYLLAAVATGLIFDVITR